MAHKRKPKLLFSGYAPVHFLCFQPIYQRLARVRDLTIHLSGGVPGKVRGVGSAADLYRPFRIPPRRVIPLGRALDGEYDMVVCAHTGGHFPRTDRHRVQIFHGLSFRNMAVRRDNLIYDHLLVTGPYMKRAFEDTRLVRKNDPRVIEAGFPKLDRLVDGTLSRKALLKRLKFSGRRPVILYAPTGQKYNSLETMGEEVLRRLKATKKYDILIKLHDHPKDRQTDWPRRLKPLLDRHTRMAPGLDIVPMMFAADLLLTDASSVSSEYALLDRPMVFLDVPQMFNAMKKKDARLDLDTWGRNAGVIAKWPDESVDAVEWSLSHPGKHGPVRRKMARDLFYNPGTAAKTAADWMLRTLELPVPGEPRDV